MSFEMFLSEKEKAKDLAAATAQQVLAGEISSLQGARELLPLLFTLELDYHEVSVMFRAVDSQTDHLPLGPTWNSATHTDSDPEIQRSEAFFRANLLTACQTLLIYLDLAQTIAIAA